MRLRLFLFVAYAKMGWFHTKNNLTLGDGTSSNWTYLYADTIHNAIFFFKNFTIYVPFWVCLKIFSSPLVALPSGKQTQPLKILI